MLQFPSNASLQQRRVHPLKSALLKRLFVAIQGNDPREVEALCRRIVQDERQRGHGQVAAELDKILTASAPPKAPTVPGTLTTLPTSRRDAAPLVHHLPHDRLRHEMVLPEVVEARLRRIEHEHAARNRLAHFGLRPRSRVLLYGPPGCGKSLAAERLAWSIGLDLKKVRFDTLISSFFGETAANLAKIFEDAAANPCALFLDECDTIAKSRSQAGNDVGEIPRVVNALLEHLEGYAGDGLVIAATNLDESLDPAIFRRFDEVVQIPQPSEHEIERLIRSSLSAIPVVKNLPWSDFARRMDGLSCAESVRIAQNAARRTVLQGRKQVTAPDFDAALSEHLQHPATP